MNMLTIIINIIRFLTKQYFRLSFSIFNLEHIYPKWRLNKKIPLIIATPIFFENNIKIECKNGINKTI